VFVFAFSVYPGLLHPHLPGLLAIFSKQGWLVLLTIAFVPYGIQIIRTPLQGK
jgi:hypothetical protein